MRRRVLCFRSVSPGENPRPDTPGAAVDAAYRVGTRPEDDPLIRLVSRRAQAEGQVQGRFEAVAATLRARAIEVSGDFAQDHDFFAEHPIEALMAAALVCTDEADFRRRVREAAG